MHERKCLKCGRWNKDEKFCANCGEALDYEEQQKIREKEFRKKEEEQRKNDKFQQFMDRLKNSPNWFVRMFYHFVYGVSIVFGIFGAFMAWLTAMINA